MEQGNGVGNVRPQPFKSSVNFLNHLLRIELGQLIAGKHFICFSDATGDLLDSEFPVKKIHNPQAAAIDLVRIGWTDSTLSGANSLVAKRRFSGCV